MTGSESCFECLKGRLESIKPETFRVCRVMLGLKQKTLAEMAGLEPFMISKIELDQSGSFTDRKAKLRNALLLLYRESVEAKASEQPGEGESWASLNTAITAWDIKQRAGASAFSESILCDVLHIPLEKHSPLLLQKVGDCLRALGWERKQVWRRGADRGRWIWVKNSRLDPGVSTPKFKSLNLTASQRGRMTLHLPMETSSRFRVMCARFGWSESYAADRAFRLMIDVCEGDQS